MLFPLVPSRAVEHPSVPEDPEYVRVRTYESQMVIRPHKTFDEVRFGGWVGKQSGKSVARELLPAPSAAPRGNPLLRPSSVAIIFPKARETQPPVALEGFKALSWQHEPLPAGARCSRRANRRFGAPGSFLKSLKPHKSHSQHVTLLEKASQGLRRVSGG